MERHMYKAMCKTRWKTLRQVTVAGVLWAVLGGAVSTSWAQAPDASSPFLEPVTVEVDPDVRRPRPVMLFTRAAAISTAAKTPAATPAASQRDVVPRKPYHYFRAGDYTKLSPSAPPRPRGESHRPTTPSSHHQNPASHSARQPLVRAAAASRPDSPPIRTTPSVAARRRPRGVATSPSATSRAPSRPSPVASAKSTSPKPPAPPAAHAAIRARANSTPAFSETNPQPGSLRQRTLARAQVALPEPPVPHETTSGKIVPTVTAVTADPISPLAIGRPRPAITPATLPSTSTKPTPPTLKTPSKPTPSAPKTAVSTPATNRVALGWPDEGLVLRGAISRVLRWLPEDAKRYASCELDFSSDAGKTWTSLATGIRPGDAVVWTTPTVTSALCQLRIVGIDANAQRVPLATSATFAVKAGSWRTLDRN